jgi:hypothetical protein
MPTDIAPTCPFPLVDLLRMTGLLVQQPELTAEGKEIFKWLRNRVSERTGISTEVIAQVIHQLAQGDGLKGGGPRGRAEAYGVWTPFDSIRVVEALRQLDKDGTTAWLWARLWEKWPVIRDIIYELSLGQGMALSPTSPGPAANGSSKSSPHSAKQRVPTEEANIRVRDWLKEHAKADPEKVTIRDVVEGTGVSQGGVHNTPAWRAFQEEREKQKGGEPRTVHLSKGIEGSRPDDTEDSPVENAIQNEEDVKDWEEIMQLAESPEERTKLKNLPEGKRQELIKYHREQRQDDGDDRRGREGRERSRRS